MSTRNRLELDTRISTDYAHKSSRTLILFPFTDESWTNSLHTCLYIAERRLLKKINIFGFHWSLDWLFHCALKVFIWILPELVERDICYKNYVVLIKLETGCGERSTCYSSSAPLYGAKSTSAHRRKYSPKLRPNHLAKERRRKRGGWGCGSVEPTR